MEAPESKGSEGAVGTPAPPDDDENMMVWAPCEPGQVFSFTRSWGDAYNAEGELDIDVKRRVLARWKPSEVRTAKCATIRHGAFNLNPIGHDIIILGATIDGRPLETVDDVYSRLISIDPRYRYPVAFPLLCPLNTGPLDAENIGDVTIPSAKADSTVSITYIGASHLEGDIFPEGEEDPLWRASYGPGIFWDNYGLVNNKPYRPFRHCPALELFRQCTQPHSVVSASNFEPVQHIYVARDEVARAHGART